MERVELPMEPVEPSIASFFTIVLSQILRLALVSIDDGYSPGIATGIMASVKLPPKFYQRGQSGDGKSDRRALERTWTLARRYKVFGLDSRDLGKGAPGVI
jgi:hypothetical protein